MSIKYSVSEKLALLLSGATQKQVALKLGVSERTVRRWKNEDVKPLASNARNLTKSFKSARKTKEHAPAARRDLREYDQKGKWTGRYRKSDWLNYDTSFMAPKSIFNLIKRVRDKNAREEGGELLVQLIMKVETLTGAKQNARTAIVDLSEFDDVDIWEWIESALQRYASSDIVAFGVLDS